MLSKKKLTSHYGIVILSDFVILNLLLNSIFILKLLPDLQTKIPFILASIFIAWLFIKQLISFRIRLKESDIDSQEKKKGKIISIVDIILIIFLTVLQIVVGLR